MGAPCGSGIRRPALGLDHPPPPRLLREHSRTLGRPGRLSNTDVVYPNDTLIGHEATVDNISLQRYVGSLTPPEKLDVRAVRALAHPLRLQLLDLLRFDGPSTATLLAKRLGESSGATSYHLRLLAKYGYIEEAPQRKGRERWWSYRERQVTLPHEGDDASAGDLLGELLSREAHALDRFLANRSRLADWDDAAFLQSQAFRLTAGELDELRRNLESLLAPLRPAGEDDPPEGTLPIRVLAFGFPLITAENE